MFDILVWEKLYLKSSYLNSNFVKFSNFIWRNEQFLFIVCGLASLALLLKRKNI